jgi:hypothetical protein
MDRLRFAFAAAGLTVLASCAAPPTRPAPPPAAPPPAPVIDWRDGALSAGTWRYVPGARSYAVYGNANLAALVIACDRAAKTVSIMRVGSASALTIATSYGEASYPAGAMVHEGVPMTGVVFNARDPLLDRIGYSRGRFEVTGRGLPPIVAPAWAEPARAVEDCRN